MNTPFNYIRLTVVALCRPAPGKKKHRPVLLLKEEGASRMLPILLSETECKAFAHMMYGMKKEPLPFAETVTQLIEGIDAIVENIVINAIERGRYQAELQLNRTEAPLTISIPATDAVLYALHTGRSVWMDATLFDLQTANNQAANNAVAIPMNVLDKELLEMVLAQAVADENYELAQMLRDEINQR